MLTVSVLSHKCVEEIPDGFRCETRRCEETYWSYGNEQQHRIAAKDTGICQWHS
jgi:hypothetical protein